MDKEPDQCPHRFSAFTVTTRRRLSHENSSLVKPQHILAIAFGCYCGQGMVEL